MTKTNSQIADGKLLNQLPVGWGMVPLDQLVFIDREKLSEGTRPDFSFYYIDITAASEGRLQLPATKITLDFIRNKPTTTPWSRTQSFGTIRGGSWPSRG
jgi:hypothetical protein